ncbi:hypothetical protein C2G38_707430 [Gigaspora rosea]|uniref:Uncharacterized protein n=1 Tax=Gigaspora rosea TaxID=44941 RepID=A0A397U1Q5_9GLOM|nr:hypothetical protein C2G38_707430 [Gigaspora rosea]
MDDRSILESADSKMNKGNNNLRSSSSAPSSDFDREEDIDPEYYDVKKRTFKILYSWEDAINKIDFKNTSKKDWILEGYNLSSEFRNFQQSTIQQVKEKSYLCYKQDIQKILCLSNVMLIESTKPAYLTCNHEIWNKVCQRQTYPRLSSVVNSIILEYSLLLNSFTPPDKIQEKWCENFSRIAELNNKEDKDDFCKCQIILRNFLLLKSINNDNEDTFVHDGLHDLIKEIFRDSMFELVWANSKSSASNKENTIKCKKPDFKLMSNKGDEILFGEVKPKDSLSISTKKDLVKLANFQADALNDLIKKYGNRIGIISLGARIRIYEMDLNYDGVYRMILIANVITPMEHAQFLNLVPVLEAFYNFKHRISEVLTVIASNIPPNSPSRSTYGRVSTPSPKPVRITIAGLRPN